jgi:phage terminase large subunit
LHHGALRSDPFAMVAQIVAEEYDWKNPDIAGEFRRRAKMLENLRKMTPKQFAAVKSFYKQNPAKFIGDWGMTADPRNLDVGLPVIIPFVLFPKQIEWVDTIVAQWKGRQPGLTEKSRDMGMSWLSIALACTLCLFHDDMVIGFGSRKEEYVDKLGAPKSLFHKARQFMQLLPKEFRGGWTPAHAPHMRIMFPESGSAITGECGDGIGRGDRTTIYFVDESAHLERPMLVDASLSATTNCRQDISTPNGMANPFAQKRHAGKLPVFTFRWQDDPRKDEAWYAKQVFELDPVTLAQEVDLSYSASVEGVVIPHQWVLASIDAHLKLGVKPSGAKIAALDVADEGVDKNALCGSHGILINFVEEWSGKNGDIFDTVEKAFTFCDQNDYSLLRYDADGLGAGVRGDARKINEERAKVGGRQLVVEAFRGSEGVFNPEGEDVKGRQNQDFFANRKAQSWWSLRTRFQNTFRAVVEGQPFEPDEIISISSAFRNYMKLVSELSQPTYASNGIGKIVIDKSPNGVKSPNLADAVMIKFAPITSAPMIVSSAAVRQFAKLRR